MFDLKTEVGRDDAFKRMGNPYQVAGTRYYKLTDGNNDNTKVIDVKTGSGLEYSIVPDRGMDISLASYKGINLTYLTRNLEVYPSFYESKSDRWLRTFFAGLLTTCGTTHLGPPCIDDGEELGLHGRHNVLLARNVCDSSNYKYGEIRVSGSIEDCTLFNSKIIIKRSICSKIGESVITIEDTIENIGSKDSPLTLLYHINFGYPFLDEKCEIIIGAEQLHAYNEYSQYHIREVSSFKKPDKENAEKNYWYAYDQKKKTAYAMIVNNELLNGLGVYIKFNPKCMPYLTQWKSEDEIDYVLALEPSNTLCYSRKDLREKGFLPIIKAHETQVMKIEIGIIEGNKRIDELKKTILGV